jgi:hypothetical protein
VIRDLGRLDSWSAQALLSAVCWLDVRRSDAAICNLGAGFNGTNWVTCHTLDGGALFPMLLDVAYFLEGNPKEVVILELTHIYNANREEEDVLRRMLNGVLGRWIDAECRCDASCLLQSSVRHQVRVLLNQGSSNVQQQTDELPSSRVLQPCCLVALSVLAKLWLHLRQQQAVRC